MTHGMLEAIRSKVSKETRKHQYGNALFWADKAVSLSGGLKTLGISEILSSKCFSIYININLLIFRDSFQTPVVLASMTY